MLKKPPLQQFEVALEIYLIIHATPQVCYTVSQLKKTMLLIHNEKLTINRIRQICESLASRKRIIKTVRPHPDIYRQTTAYQADFGNAILMDSPVYKVAETISKIQERCQKHI